MVWLVICVISLSSMIFLFLCVFITKCTAECPYFTCFNAFHVIKSCVYFASGKMDKRRQPNFTSDELEILLSSVEGKSKILFGKFGGAVTAAAKDKCWADVAAVVTSASGIERSAKEVKKKWSTVKSAVKSTVSSAKKDLHKTGGGPQGDIITEFDSKIIGIMGEVGKRLYFVSRICLY